MLETLITLGQAASVLLLLYGAFLVVLPQRRRSDLALEEEVTLLRHLHSDA